MLAGECNRLRARNDWPPVDYLGIDLCIRFENNLKRISNLVGWLAFLGRWNPELLEESLLIRGIYTEMDFEIGHI